MAKAQHKSVDGLKKAILDGAKKDLDQAVKSGFLTEAQAKDALDELQSRIDDIVNGTFPDPARVNASTGGKGRPTTVAGECRPPELLQHPPIRRLRPVTPGGSLSCSAEDSRVPQGVPPGLRPDAEPVRPGADGDPREQTPVRVEIAYTSAS